MLIDSVWGFQTEGRVLSFPIVYAHARGVFCAPAGSWVESQSAAWLKCGTDELKSSNTVNHVTFTVKHQQLRWLLPQKLQYKHYLLKSILRFDFNFSIAIKIKAKEEIHNNTGTIQKKQFSVVVVGFPCHLTFHLTAETRFSKRVSCS